MFTNEILKAVFGKASRSGFYYFITPALLFRHAPETRYDPLSGVTVVGLFASLLILMRLLLAN